MMGEQFSVSWTNHHLHFMSALTSYWQKGTLVDVTLTAEGRLLHAHKVVLSACSSVFESLFIANPCQHPIVMLKDVQYDDLKAVLDFMYLGQIYTQKEKLPQILKIIKLLEMKTELPKLPQTTSCSDSSSGTDAEDSDHESTRCSPQSQQEFPQQEPPQQLTEGMSKEHCSGEAIQYPHDSSSDLIMKTETIETIDLIDDSTQEIISDQNAAPDMTKQTPIMLSNIELNFSWYQPPPSHMDPIFPLSPSQTNIDGTQSSGNYMHPNGSHFSQTTWEGVYILPQVHGQGFTPYQCLTQQQTVNQTVNTNGMSTSRRFRPLRIKNATNCRNISLTVNDVLLNGMPANVAATSYGMNLQTPLDETEKRGNLNSNSNFKERVTLQKIQTVAKSSNVSDKENISM